MIKRGFNGVYLLYLILLWGCGIPTVSFLSPPIEGETTGTNSENYILSFRHNSSNDIDDFRGYEIYYKLYEIDSKLIAQDETYISNTPVSPGIARLTTRNFLRLASIHSTTGEEKKSITEDAFPHVAISPTGTEIEVKLDVRSTESRNIAGESANIVASWSQGASQIIEFRRRTSTKKSDDREKWKGFWDRNGYQQGDTDIRKMFSKIPVLSDDNAKLQIVFYIISYGIDGKNFNVYYSTPLRLEPVTITTVK